ncbi:MAG TPA: TPM domain-containing protein [Candidatus Microbacterium pullistercoris]|nr:TPM domain-containing protein [Candidatus Microbacterium pullistercoris]
MRNTLVRWVAALGAGLALVLAPATAWAADPPSLGNGYVHDGSDVLSDGEERAANERLDGLAAGSDVQLWVVFVDDFTNPADSASWADQTAESNGLGAGQYLLAIATEGRQLYLSAPAEGALSEQKLVGIEQAAGAALSSNDWVGAVDAAADELQERSQPNYTAWWVVGGLVVVAVIVIVGLGVARKAKKRREAAAAREQLTAEVDRLRSEASALLVDMDDSLRTAEQEVGFAVAEFGADAVVEFREALREARGALDTAFAIQQRLDDETPETLEQQHELYEEIITLLERSDETLDAKAESFDELRALSRNAPQALERLTSERAAAADAPERAAADLARLRETYASPALDDVEDNDEQAAARLEFVDVRLAEAREHLDADDAGEAALDLHEAEQALAQALDLAGAASLLEEAFHDAEAEARQTLADLESDIAQAQSMEDPAGALARAVEATRGHIAAARENLSGTARTPLLLAQELDRANEQMDAAIGSAREAAEARRRLEQQLDQAIRQATGQLSSADTLVRTLRGGVGSSARARLAQARTLLDRAHDLRSTDPDSALRDARRARDIAHQAASAARADVRRYSAGGYGMNTGGGVGAGIGGNIVGGIVGGLLGSALSGGSRRGSGWGRSSRGFSAGFGGRGRSGGGFSASRGRTGGGRRF